MEPLIRWKSLCFPRRLSFWHLGGALALLLGAAVLAEATERREYAIKAAFLYNFTQFVEWPPETLQDEGFVIAVVGPNPFGDVLDQIVAGHEVQGHPIVVRYVATMEEARGAEIIFISRWARVAPADFFAAAAEDQPSLTVSDAEGFARRGGMIALLTENNRVRMEVNPEAIRERGLSVSSRLLRLAAVVGDKQA